MQVLSLLTRGRGTRLSTVATGTRAAALLAALVLVLLGSAGAARGSTGGAGGELPPGTVEAPEAGQTPFDRHGMWVWYMDRIEGGDLGRIIARAKRNGIGTLYVKSGDAGNYWGQFNRKLVRRLHAAGLDVCAWQFVYGDRPLAEARVAAAAVRRGADCFVIDAEGHYEGKYAAADRYVRALRARVGDDYPVSLASFPYVDYHPSFPYSVFLGPGGATFNQPQMYWRTIGTSVHRVYEHTYLYNRLWGHPIYPIGQTYQGPPGRELIRFRRLAHNFGGQAQSWWAWHETRRHHWGALRRHHGGPVRGYRPAAEHPDLRRGSRGDLVVWAQMHLRGAGETTLPITGFFGPQTRDAVRSFQDRRDLPVTGVVDDETWDRLLEARPVRPLWGGRRARAGDASASAALPARRPASASLSALAYEVDPGPRP